MPNNQEALLMHEASIAILSDVHANFQALEAVLAHAHRQGVDQFWFLGDAVNYGPEPHFCLPLLRKVIDPNWWVVGNHDRALQYYSGETSFAGLSIESKRAVIHQVSENKDINDTLALHAQLLKHFSEETQFLFSRPESICRQDVFLVHGGIANGATTTYIRTPWDFKKELTEFSLHFPGPPPRYFFSGQTHLPTHFQVHQDTIRRLPCPAGEETLLEGEIHYLNPGSVGQPRDGDPRAAYAIFKPKKSTITFHRVDYPVETTIAKSHGLGICPNFYNRLRLGG